MSSEVASVQPPQPRSVVRDMSDKYGMEPQAFEAALRATVVPSSCSPAQFAAFLLVAKKYDLDPVTKQIYAFPSKGGGITPIVGIDGWLHLANSHPAFNGMEFDDILSDGKLAAITCRVFRKDRDKPMSCTEYMSECKRDTDPWRKSPARMLRHRAAIQAIRYAFSFSGIVDEDEYGRIGDSVTAQVVGSGPLKLAMLEDNSDQQTAKAFSLHDEPIDDEQAAIAKSLDALNYLENRWRKAYPKNKGETADQHDERFIAWANRVGDCDAVVATDLTDDAVEKCNISLDEMESN